MSLILDALRKLDREKSSRRNGPINIAIEILRPYVPPPRKRMWIYFTAVFLTAVASAAITYAVISKRSPPANIKLAASSLQVTPVPLSPEPARDTRDEMPRGPAKMQAPVERKRPVERKKPVETKKPAEIQKPTESRKPAESEKQPVEVKIPPLSPGEEKISSEVISKEPPAVPGDMKKPAEQTPRGPAVTPASLKLSGIVWSEDPSKRLAVINGMVTTEGYVFEGVKVMEIHPDHVLLFLNDQPFELSLNK
jgi:general secretion pathway protein B